MTFKRYLLLAIAVFVSISAFSQAGTFTKMFTSNSYDEGIAAFRMPNKTYRIIANTGAWGWGSSNIWYITLDSNANFVKHKTIGYGGIDNARAAAIDSKGNTYIIGSSTSNVGNSYQMLFVALDSSGTLITKKYFGSSNWDFGNGIKIINDTTIILVGETYSYASQQSNAWVMKINNTGDIIWSKSVGGNQKDAFYAVEEAKNGDIICVGNSQSYGNGSYDPFMYRCANNGDSISQIIVADSTEGRFTDIIVAADSSYIISGYQWDTTNTYHDLSLQHYTKNNQLIWNEGSLLQKQDASFNTLAFRGNSILAFGKTTLYGSEGDNVYCAKINSGNGTWMDGFVAGEKGDESAYSVTTDTSNSQTHYLIVGTSNSYNMVHNGVYFMRVNFDLEFDTTMVIDMPSAINSIENQVLSIDVFYDSPQRKIIIDKISEFNNNNAVIKIYDISGRCIYSENWIANRQAIISTKTWSLGSYLIKISSANKSFSRLIIL